ncbi:MAG: CHASE2 domain-containing protein, partial [Myxococcaceae bacterium]
MSRRKYELVGLAVAVSMALLHLGTDGRQAGTRTGPAMAMVRLLSSLEGRVSDLQIRARGVRAPHPDVVVVAVDERSVQRHGRWPWRRELIAEAITRLDAAGPAAIGLDITFTDQDPGSESAAMGEAAEALGRAVAGLPEPSRQPFTPVLAGLRA